MRRRRKFTLPAALLSVLLEVPAVAQADSPAQAALVASCDMHLRVELSPHVPDPRNIVSSLLSKYPDYRLTLQRQDPDNSAVIAVELTGPGPEEACREVMSSMRKDTRVTSVDVEGDAVNTTLTASTTERRRGARPAGAVQPMGTLHAGPDGDWILEPLNGVSYMQQARDRYECDLWAVRQTGFDPTKDDGGVPAGAAPGKRAEYLRAEGACFQSRWLPHEITLDTLGTRFETNLSRVGCADKLRRRASMDSRVSAGHVITTVQRVREGESHPRGAPAIGEGAAPRGGSPRR